MSNPSAEDGWWIQASLEACRPASLCHSDQQETLFQTMCKTKDQQLRLPSDLYMPVLHTITCTLQKMTNNVWQISSQKNGLQGKLELSVADDKIRISQPFPFSIRRLSELEHSSFLRHSSCPLSSPLFWHSSHVCPCEGRFSTPAKTVYCITLDAQTNPNLQLCSFKPHVQDT